MVKQLSRIQLARRRINKSSNDLRRYQILHLRVVALLEKATGELGDEEVSDKQKSSALKDAVKCIFARREIKKEIAAITRSTEQPLNSLGSLIHK